MKRRPAIGVTFGDPAGIGPEVAAAAIAERTACGADFRVIGVDRPVRPGRPDRETAQMALDALEEAASLAMGGGIDAVVTGPVSKHHLHRAGFAFPGQTEFFADRSGTSDFAMLLTGGNLTVGLVTAHVPFARVIEALTTDEIIRVGKLLHGFCSRRFSAPPRIAVAGLNPHAGESGDLGREEIEVIGPATASLQEQFPGCFSGPHSPDTVFLHAVEGRFHAVLCMYHDQGLIPLKLHAFDCGVNVTLGLPFVRTSPDHGTAFELAGKGTARHTSMGAAIDLAIELTHSQKILSGQPGPAYK